MNREMARLSPFPEKAIEINNLARTIEIPYWIIAVFLCGITLLISPILSVYWVNSETLPIGTITTAFMIMSVGFGFQWVIGLYVGGLMGLQKQVPLNILSSIFATCRSGGAVLILEFFSPTISGFLVWQALITLLQAVTMRLYFWKSLPTPTLKPKFEFSHIRRVGRFAGGIAAISLLSILLTQVDKVILSRTLTLENFGYYSLAILIATNCIYSIVAAFSAAYFPKFTQLAATSETASLKETYHRACQLLSVILIPTSATLAFFSYETLLLWSGSAEIAAEAYKVLALLAIGIGLHGSMSMPYNMQLAQGRTRLTIYLNLALIVIIIPVMIYGAVHFGALGGAAAWLLLMLIYLIVAMPLMHRNVLSGELPKWYLVDLGLPLATAIAVATVWRFLFPINIDRVALFLCLSLVWLSTSLIIILTTPYPRERLVNFINRTFRPRRDSVNFGS